MESISEDLKKGPPGAGNILSALSEIITQQKEALRSGEDQKIHTPVDYFSALFFTLSQQKAKPSSDETLAGLTYLLSLICDKVPTAVLASRFGSLGNILLEILTSKEEQALEISRSILSILTKLLKARIATLKLQGATKNTNPSNQEQEKKNLSHLWVNSSGRETALKMIKALLVFSISESTVSNIARKGAGEILSELSSACPLPKTLEEAIVGICTREIGQITPKTRNNMASLSELLQVILISLSTTSVANILLALIK